MKKQEFWDDRAEIGEHAGTNDYLLKNLEIELLRERVPHGSRLLDAGCGNGNTIIDLAENNNITGLGFDFSSKMVASAQAKAEEKHVADRLDFIQGSLQEPPGALDSFDVAITERSLINLDSDEDQYKAFMSIMERVKPGGSYLMLESSRQGLERTNELRVSLGLEPIEMPWHNHFVDEEFVRSWADGDHVLEEMYPFSSSYYLLSRVVYARLAADKNEDLRYDSDINLISVKLPPVGDFGPTRLWHWRRA